MVEGVFKADLLIVGDKIEGFYKPGDDVRADEIIDCSGKLILPGVIDAHVHFREPGQSYKEDWESGSRVALSGGVTTVFDMPNNDPPIVSVKALEAKRKLVNGRSYINYGFFIGYNGKNLQEVNAASGVPGVKLYMANSTGDMGVDFGIEELFRGCNKLVVVHAEDEKCIAENLKRYLAEFAGREIDPAVHSKIRASSCAVLAVKQLCILAKKTGHKVHIAHVSTGSELEIIAEHKKFGVSCEVAPHHLLFCEDDYETKGNLIKMNPPVRSRVDLFALWKGLKFGEIDIIATDHAPHTIEEKSQDYLKVPSGVPGVGMMLPIMLNAVNDEGLEIPELVKLCCERPAEIFGVKGKGKLEEGYDADIVVVDMDIEKKIVREDVKDKCGWSPYEGSTFKGWPVMTFVGGELKYKDGKVLGKASGKEVKFR